MKFYIVQQRPDLSWRWLLLVDDGTNGPVVTARSSQLYPDKRDCLLNLSLEGVPGVPIFETPYPN